MDFKVWECQICSWRYDEEKGCPQEGIEPGTRWEDIPEDWSCPECGVGKEDFEMVEVVSAEAKTPVATQNVTVIEAQASETLPIVIIGTGLAGYQLVKEIRALDADTPIVMYTNDDGAYYSKPQLSNAFSANKSAAALVIDSAENMAQRFSVEINIYTAVTGIDGDQHRVILENGGNRQYAKLVFALGAGCVKVPLSGTGLDKVHSVNDLSDYARLRTLIKPTSRILIIGAGLIGSEYADDLTQAGHQVSVVDPLDGALATLLPPEASTVLTEALSAKGIRYYFGTTVEAVSHQNGGLSVTFKNGQRVEVDRVVSAVGIRPNIALASQLGVHCEKGICVDEQMQTSRADIFAIGDCAQVNGSVLPYVAPLNAQAKVLSKILCAEEAALQYGVMPVAVKTRSHPVIVYPPGQAEGHWEIEVNQMSGVHARFLNTEGVMIGFALTGDQCRFSGKLSANCQPPL